MQPSEDYLKASVYIERVVQAKPAPSLLWSIMLGGKLVCDPEYIETEGKCGTALKFNAATATPRTMHISPNFARAHEKEAFELMWHSTARGGST